MSMDTQSPIRQPVRAVLERRMQCSVLHFSGGRSGEYEMVGGICWPTTWETDEGVRMPPKGYAVLCGRDLSSGVVHVFEQREFLVISHMLEPDRSIKELGLAPWFNTCWALYYAREFFYAQRDELVRRFYMDVTRDDMINPKPLLMPMDFAAEPEAKQILWRYVAQKELNIPRDSALAEALRAAPGADDKKPLPPPMHALLCALVAYDTRHRPVKVKHQEEQIKWA